MDKNILYIVHNEISFRKEWNHVICSNRDKIEDITVSEISQAQKDRYCMFTYV
jgi:hypothetical protein